MSTIWHVQSKQNSGHNLWRDQSGIYWIVQFSSFTKILVGSDYTIVHKSLLPAFDLLLSDQLEIKPVVIRRRATNEEWSDYRELIIKRRITRENIKSTDSFG